MYIYFYAAVPFFTLGAFFTVRTVAAQFISPVYLFQKSFNFLAQLVTVLLCALFPYEPVFIGISLYFRSVQEIVLQFN